MFDTHGLSCSYPLTCEYEYEYSTVRSLIKLGRGRIPLPYRVNRTGYASWTHGATLERWVWQSGTGKADECEYAEPGCKCVPTGAAARCLALGTLLISH